MSISAIGVRQSGVAVYTVCKEKLDCVTATCKHVAQRAFSALSDFFRQCVQKVYRIFERKVVPAPAAVVSVNARYSLSPEFLRVTRYLPEVDKVLQQSELRKANIKVFCTLLQQGDWKNVIKEYRQRPELLATDALKAFAEQLITESQWTTTLFCYALMVDFPEEEIHVEPLFNEDESVNKIAEEAISYTMHRKGPYLTGDQLTTFFTKMRSEPKSEQAFFFVSTQPYNWGIDCKKASEKIFIHQSRTVMEAVAVDAYMNVFHQFVKDEKTYRMMPSLSMMQQFLHTYARAGDAVKITPVIGLSTPEDIEKNIVDQQRDMALPFPGMQFPIEADCLKAPYKVDVIGHDFYHSYTCSEISSSLRPAFAELATIIKDLQKQCGKEQEKMFLEAFYERVIDMEYCSFKQLEAGLWEGLEPMMHTLEHLTRHTINRMVLQECRQDVVNKVGTVSRELVEERFLLHRLFLTQEKTEQKLAELLCKCGFYLKYNITIPCLEKYLRNKSLRFASRSKEEQQEIRASVEKYSACKENEIPSELQGFIKKAKKKLTINGVEKSLLDLEFDLDRAQESLIGYSLQYYSRSLPSLLLVQKHK